MNYWQQRMAKSQEKLTSKNIREINKQLKKYYGSAMNKVITDFEATYNKILATAEDGKEITPADLYRLDKYWQAQAAMRMELQKLGDRQINAMSKIFEIQFFDIYYSIGIPGSEAFNTIDAAAARQLINTVWCADGKNWSSRVWKNTELLAETLNEELIHCVATGKKTSHLKKVLQDRFDVGYNNADMLARTEMAHIQTQAAQQRYKDYGITQVEVLVDEDERTCPICAKYEGKRYPIHGQMPVPFHPRCRCCVIPVVETEEND